MLRFLDPPDPLIASPLGVLIGLTLNNSPMEGERTFAEILAEVQRTKTPITTLPHVALKQLGAGKRGWRVVEAINEMLDRHDVICEPDFGSAWIYGPIEIRPRPKVSTGSAKHTDDYDSMPRLSLLKAANLNKVKDGIGLISVKRDTPLFDATTLMMIHDFSQLPILSGERQVEGLVSWKSVGRALSLGKECKTVSDCKEEVTVLNSDDTLFSAVKVVLEKEVVVVKQKDGIISGIVTVTDIGEQFIAMAEPFLFIEQIENHVRRILNNKFNPGELVLERENGEKVEVKDLANLTFGEYVRIIGEPAKFDKLKLKINRQLFVKQLEEVRKIRNEVMHFDPEGISAEKRALLRQTLNFLHTILNTLRERK